MCVTMQAGMDESLGGSQRTRPPVRRCAGLTHTSQLLDTTTRWPESASLYLMAHMYTFLSLCVYILLCMPLDC